MTRYQSRPQIERRNAAVKASIERRLTQAHGMMFDGVIFTAETLIAFFDGQSAAMGEVDRLKREWLDAIKEEDAYYARATVVLRGLKEYVRQAFREDAEALTDFGFDALKPRAPQTPEQKARIIRRYKATRARNKLAKGDPPRTE